MGYQDYFKNKNAIVTGAASGIGKELTLQLLHAGARVTATDINEAGLKQLKLAFPHFSELNIATLDVVNREHFAEIIERTKQQGPLDFMFNNAGYAIFDETLALTAEQWDKIIDVNIRGVVNGTTLAYQTMCQQQHGHIVNTASGAGLMPIPLMTAYCTTKYAVVGLSSALRNEAKRHNVKVSVICPGVISTNIFSAAQSHKFNIQALRKKTNVGEVPVEKAVKKILKQVAADQSKIVFPFSIKMAERFHALAPDTYSKISQMGIRQFLERTGN